MTGDLDEAELKKLVPAGRFGEPEEGGRPGGFPCFACRFLATWGGDFNKRWIIYLIERYMNRVVITGMGIYSCIGRIWRR